MKQTEERHTKVISVRATPAQHAVLCTRARECGLPVSTFLREVGLGAIPRARPQRIEKEAVYHLGRIGNNLNQLAYVANATGHLNTEQHLRKTTEELLAAIRRLV